MSTPTLPANHEHLPADFLRKFGAVKGMKFCQNHSGAEWKSVNYKVGAMLPGGWEKHFWCAPTGTCAAASTPLPVPECDCAYDQVSNTGGHFPHCSSRLRYRHVLPHELAAMESKPEGLVWALKGCNDWTPYELAWPFLVDESDVLCAYAVPVRAEEGNPSGCSVERQLTQLQETLTLREFAIAQLTRERDGLRTSLANAREHLQMVAAERDSLARQLDLANELRPLSTQTRKEGGVEKPTAEAADANANVLGSCSGASPDSSPLSQPQSEWPAEIEALEERIRQARHANAAMGAAEDSPEIEQLVAERERMLSQPQSETGAQDYQQRANDLQQQLNAMRAAIERELAWWDRDGEPCKCGTCAVCGLRASIQPKL